ncbi:TPA: hypothetical protein HA273_01985 [Candidatus Bathyarchaeota archaeon]|nr:hypothetical protein [Candidatus Bathyarchaeota archaeon]
MKVEEAKALAKSVTEVAEGQKESCRVISDTGSQAAATKKLFREGNKSNLIKLGIALIVFPEPTPISEIVGGSLVVAGAVKQGIKNRAAFADDIGRDFKKALKDLSITKDLL